MNYVPVSLYDITIDPLLGSFIALLVFAAIAVIFGWMLSIMRKNRKDRYGRPKK